MAISARNKLQGRVSSIKSGEAMCLVILDAQGTKIVAAVTNQGVEELNLKQNDQVTAVIKSTEVILMKGGGQVTLSARNVRENEEHRLELALVPLPRAVGRLLVSTGKL
ncbi:MAG TPA: TOBE domain-containing protein, partial [Nitrospiraceae bacterium]|nr:TOBE domain-containing protein [Nitrospiraceae bacterium]